MIQQVHPRSSIPDLDQHWKRTISTKYPPKDAFSLYQATYQPANTSENTTTWLSRRWSMIRGIYVCEPHILALYTSGGRKDRGISWISRRSTSLAVNKYVRPNPIFAEHHRRSLIQLLLTKIKREKMPRNPHPPVCVFELLLFPYKLPA